MGKMGKQYGDNIRKPMLIRFRVRGKNLWTVGGFIFLCLTDAIPPSRDSSGLLKRALACTVARTSGWNCLMACIANLLKYLILCITGLDKQNFERKIVNIFLPISLNICF